MTEGCYGSSVSLGRLVMKIHMEIEFDHMFTVTGSFLNEQAATKFLLEQSARYPLCNITWTNQPVFHIGSDTVH